MIMLRTLILLVILAPASSSAQYIHYSEKVIIKNVVAGAKPKQAETPPREMEPKKSSVNFISVDCPGLSASLPVLYSYVPPNLVNKLRQQFSGHLYCITAQKISATTIKYKLKVCVKGEFHEEFVDEEGTLLE